MNAVERLLAHADRTVALFDEMLGPCRESIDPHGESMLWRAIAPYTSGGPFAPNEAADGPPSLRGTLSPERLALMERWASDDAASASVARAVKAGGLEGKRHGDGADLSPLALRVYCDHLAEREELLDEKALRAMVADVVAASLDWGPHASEVVNLSKTLIASLSRLLHRDPVPGHDSSGRMVGHFHGGPVRTRKEWESEKRHRMQPAIEALRIYARPPASAATSEQKTVSKQPKHRKRPGSGGRPAKFPIKFIREVVTARERDQKHAAKARRPLLPFPQWLSEYFTNVKKLPLSTLPHKDPKKPEEWSIRANRFWKSAKTRLSRAGD
jgi:hypothetical protein